MELDRVIQGDCIEWMDRQAEPFADLIFADPPFNIGYKYDVYEDRRKYDEYYDWTRRWITACRRVLKPQGSFWIAIGDDYAAEIRMIGRDLNLHLRNWVIWHYTFGQQTKAKFARSHTHLFYFVADPKQFTFDDKAVRTFSDRQRVYKDKRASALGKLPDDTWNEYPRLCGTFGEREGWHPCQMPETVLNRIIRTCSRPGETVFDPFAGSGTTLAVAKKLSRRFLGTELSPQYAEQVGKRLAGIQPMRQAEVDVRNRWPADHVELLKAAYLEAGVSTSFLHAQPTMLASFAQQFNWRLEACGCQNRYEPAEVWAKIESLRKSIELPKVRVHAEEPKGWPVRALGPDLFAEDQASPSGGRRKRGRRPLNSPTGTRAEQ